MCRLPHGLELGLLDSLHLELRLWLNDRLRITKPNTILMLFFIDRHNVHRLILGQHIMVQLPSCTTRKLSNNNIAVAQELNVKVDVMDGLQMSVQSSSCM